ncbi:hypothetical protein [Singulisphaera sp. PoT]|uniref:hypothetical protein n=1 Tax=Singulisphaera sp. PoT TaxID=3411797 RepID=UPI003BF485CF
MKKPMIRRLAVVALSALPWASGCGGGNAEENLSVKGDADPAKLQKAQAEADAAAAKAKAAEAAKTRGKINVEQ